MKALVFLPDAGYIMGRLNYCMKQFVKSGSISSFEIVVNSNYKDPTVFLNCSEGLDLNLVEEIEKKVRLQRL